MDESLFRVLLTTLRPATLAAMLADLQEAQAEWQHYPEEAPALTTQEALLQIAALISEIGQNQTPNFQQLVEQAQVQKAEQSWAEERDQQEVENWLSDFD
jgi:hypothetical protein